MLLLFVEIAVAAIGHDNPAIGLRAGGEGGDVRHILQGGVDHMALISVHGLQGDVSAVFRHLCADLFGQALQGFLPLCPVGLSVDIDADPLCLAAVDGVVCQVLDRVEGVAAAAPSPPDSPAGKR